MEIIKNLKHFKIKQLMEKITQMKIINKENQSKKIYSYKNVIKNQLLTKQICKI